jgi:hypothetical protein
MLTAKETLRTSMNALNVNILLTGGLERIVKFS